MGALKVAALTELARAASLALRTEFKRKDCFKRSASFCTMAACPHPWWDAAKTVSAGSATAMYTTSRQTTSKHV